MYLIKQAFLLFYDPTMPKYLRRYPEWWQRYREALAVISFLACMALAMSVGVGLGALVWLWLN